MRRLIARILPSGLKHLLHYTHNSVLDGIDFVTGRCIPMVPPRRKIFIGGGDFQAAGTAFLKTLERHTLIKPSAHILDMGSGQGRMALPLTGYLEPTGEYHGVEIVPSAVDWCNKEYADLKNFHFHHADIHNNYYNPDGKLTAAHYRFPFADNSFDLTFLTSVFTHMYTPAIEQYLAEIYRCLKPGGECLATFFLLNDLSIAASASAQARLRFEHAVDGLSATTTPKNPEDAIAVNEAYLTDLLAQKGFTVNTIRYGYWTGQAPAETFQDFIVATANKD